MALSDKTMRLLLSALGSPESRDELVSDIQDIQSSEIANGAVTTDKLDSLAVTNAKVATGIDAAKIGGGAVSNTEFSYLDGVTSGIQAQITATVAVANAALPSASFTDAAVSGKLITGFSSSPGTVAGTDTILQSINKLDGNISSILRTANVTLTTAQILALNTTPISVLAAPGVGYCNVIESVYSSVDFNSAAYSAGSDALELRYTNGAGAKLAELSNSLLESAADNRELAQPSNPLVPVENAAIVAFVPNADPTVGDSDIKLRIFYRQVPVLL